MFLGPTECEITSVTDVPSVNHICLHQNHCGITDKHDDKTEFTVFGYESYGQQQKTSVET